ncbi:MAG: MFS transporter [Acidobacteria bacterium]|nr:MAG: MFS transporter [Acidobacteriota bacterium]
MAQVPLLERLGLHRPELRAWAMYDWANSVFMTTGLLIFPIYLADVASAGSPVAVATARYSMATTVSMAVVAVLSPILGAIADYTAMKKKMLAAFALMGILATGGMYFIERGDWRLALILFLFANTGVTASIVFYESLLPHIARQDEVDRVSTAGYAMGYLGSSLLMVLNIAWIQKPALFGISSPEMAIRLTFLSSALWWLVFTIPLLRRVPEPPLRLEADERPGLNPVAVGFRRLRETLREIRVFKHTFLFLLAFFIYNDGIGTIIRMATIYGREIGIERGALLMPLLLVQVVGIPFSFLFGALADRIGAKPAIFVSLAVYLVISILGYRMTTARDFFVLALLVGTVQGGSQALSRSVFSTLVPRHKSSEFFAFFSVFEKFAGILGPAVFTIMISATGSSRSAVLSIIVFFAVGGMLLAFVDVKEGQRAAREAEARLTDASASRSSA